MNRQSRILITTYAALFDSPEGEPVLKIGRAPGGHPTQIDADQKQKIRVHPETPRPKIFIVIGVADMVPVLVIAIVIAILID